MGRRCLWGLSLLAVLLVVGCARAKLARQAAPASNVAHVRPIRIDAFRFELEHAPGAAPFIVSRQETPFTLNNCLGEAPLTRDYRDSLSLTLHPTLDITGLGIDLTPYRAVMESVIRQAYDIAGGGELKVEDTVALEMAPHHNGQFTVRWEEMWDQNALKVLKGDQVVATAPFAVLRTARLTATRQTQLPCSSTSPTPASIALPNIASEKEGAREAQGTLTIQEGPTLEPASDEALALVRDYLAALNAHNYARAYDLLHPQYQAGLPYADYVKSYELIGGLEVQDIEAIRETRYKEIVTVNMTIAQLARGEKVSADWSGTYEVMITRGKPPYQRSITAIAMHRVDRR